ncbi:MAG: class I SAM-dependent methyltransferase [Anaerolineae bacterium]|nr:class I SAM-dependent methyltransferase [Thermoflexales bacterium]MDW8407558.1 class I SAM-dependent methyltransferase [Anaerolineae bacterium]
MTFNPFDNAQIAAGYESWYETEGAGADRAERRLLQRWLKRLGPPGSAIEIGCGTGHFTRWLAELGWNAVGVDIAAPMLFEAAQRDGARYLRADSAHLPFSAGRFDIALMITSLEFMPDPARALREAARVAQRGVVLGVLNAWSVMGWQRKRSGLPVWQAAHFYTPFELARLARESCARAIADITWATTLLPGAFEQRISRLPFGGFIGLCVVFGE